MKHAVALIAAFIIVWIAWKIIMPLVSGAIALVLGIAALALFGYLVYVVYKALTREKLIM